MTRRSRRPVRTRRNPTHPSGRRHPDLFDPGETLYSLTREEEEEGLLGPEDLERIADELDDIADEVISAWRTWRDAWHEGFIDGNETDLAATMFDAVFEAHLESDPEDIADKVVDYSETVQDWFTDNNIPTTELPQWAIEAMTTSDLYEGEYAEPNYYRRSGIWSTGEFEEEFQVDSNVALWNVKKEGDEWVPDGDEQISTLLLRALDLTGREVSGTNVLPELLELREEFEEKLSNAYEGIESVDWETVAENAEFYGWNITAKDWYENERYSGSGLTGMMTTLLSFYVTPKEDEIVDALNEALEEAAGEMPVDPRSDDRRTGRAHGGEKLWTSADGEHMVVRLTNREQLAEEGKLLKHCVGSYWAAVEKGYKQIWSFRKADNSPMFTIEVNAREGEKPSPSDIVQVLGKANRWPGYSRKDTNYDKPPIRGRRFQPEEVEALEEFFLDEDIDPLKVTHLQPGMVEVYEARGMPEPRFADRVFRLSAKKNPGRPPQRWQLVREDVMGRGRKIVGRFASAEEAAAESWRRLDADIKKGVRRYVYAVEKMRSGTR